MPGIDAQERSPSGAPLRVLLVEDSPEDAERTLLFLRDAGLQPEAERVETVQQLTAALKLHAFDVVLCDYALPALDAATALAIVKRERPDLPLIIVAGTIGEEAAVRAMRDGASDVFNKDKLARLAAAIERELREAATRRERAKLREQLLLSDRLISIGTLAAGVAHEINNPLAYVVGNIEFALERLTGAAASGLAASDCEELASALQQAREGAERIRITTRDLRVFCRSEDSAPTTVDVARVIESAISMAWNEIRHRARIVREFQPIPCVEANESRLGQVFLNLLINAAQAIERADPNRHEIRVATGGSHDRVFVEIADTGSGMSAEVQSNLFEPFYTTKPIGVGTGLGLSICRGIVEELGGEISVRSELGLGTTIRVELPASRSSSMARPSRPAAPISHRARVLVVDDEPSLCHIVERLLGDVHDVTIALDARLALDRLRAEPDFDVILCDLMMPEMSGMEFHAELCERAPQLAERVIFLTGGAFSGAASQFLDRVGNPRLDKPFDPNTLRKHVAKMLARGTPVP